MIVSRFLLTICFFFLISVLSAQTVKNYESEWKRVEDLIQKRNLPKSALAEVKKIYAMAKRDQQPAQVIKALVFMSTLQQENREDNLQASILDIEKEIAVQKEPATSILKSLLATLYFQYFQNNRWQLYNRTNTVNFNKNDIATWTLQDFHKKISNLYLESLQNKRLLQQTKLSPFDAIIIKGNTRQLRPTLYDLLAHHALNYFQSNERDLKKPAYAFEINQQEAFAPAAEFVKHKFVSADSLSLQHKALEIYQELIAFHLKDPKPDALIDADLQRLQFVLQNATIDNKKDLYLQALQSITKTYPNHPATAQAFYLIALHHHELASLYQPFGDTTNRYERVKAVEILQKVVKDSTVKSEGWVNSYNLLNELKRLDYSFELEKVNTPTKPFRALVRYRNTDALYFRLLTATEELKDMLQNWHEDKYWNAVTNATAIRSWQQPLPSTNDYQNHSVEVKIDALPVGEYILLSSTDPSFKKGKNSLGGQLFYVSNISYINQGSNFFVLHRESGQPLSNALVELFSQQYNYNTSKWTRRKEGDYNADKNGYFLVQKKRETGERGYSLNITHGNDKLFLRDQIYNYYSEGRQPSRDILKRTFFFTDRSIYRPGQTVHFKGIVVNSNKNQNSIETNYSTTVYLRNANYEIVDSLKLTTNEFGSYNGKFTLPQNVLNGQFSIVDKDKGNEVSFSVEEYKRPKFYVQFNKIKDTYKAGDTITITGIVKAYAGNNIDQASVTYRVVRQPRFPYPWIRWRIWPPQGEPMEIAHGNVTTDENGNFSFRFAAIPDKKIDRKLEPVFDYKIYVDVTDQAGETRSAQNLVSAGYKSLLIKVQLPERIAADSLKNISVRTENMNGEYQPSTVTVAFFSLLPEQRLVRNRYWEQPDQHIMTKEEFISFFPNDEYKNESDFKTWEVGNKVFTKTDTTSSSSLFNIEKDAVKPGFYKVEITTTDKDGNEVKDVRYLEVFDPNSNKLNRPEYLWTKGSKPIEPGEKTEVVVGSSAPSVFLIKQVDKTKADKAATDLQYTNLNNEKKDFTFSASEADRGGYGVSFFFVKDNRFYQFNDIIQVPWTNKDLDIEFATFRDKTLPGSEEKWTIKLKGYKNEKAAAEMLASMYDASLDQFRQHNWSKPGIWPVYANLYAWNGMQNFASIQSYQTWHGGLDHKQFNKTYDRFIFADYYGGGAQEIIVTAFSRRDNGIRPPAVKQEQADAEFDMSTKRTNVNGAAGGDINMTTDTMTILEPPIINQSQVQIRKNFNETAFFFPELRTDKDGNITFSFTTPEALTTWKLQTFTHTKDLAMGIAQKQLITQKELMVQPNMSRFLRQGDRIELSAKIVNLSASEFTGQAELQLLDATTNQPVDGWFLNSFPNQYFTVAAGQSEVVKFPVEVPHLFTGALTWRIIARSGNLSDGEENILPVLSNRLLVTETLPMPVRGNQTKAFNFEKLLTSGSSESLQHHALTVEYTSNPAWYAVQALPYLAEKTNESAEQTWNRYYANSLANKIINAAPRIRQIFEQWKTLDTAALLSNLQKNQELKSALLEETPWVLQAKTEEQQKKNIALLFDMVRISSELQSAFSKLKELQSPNGGFVWFKGAPDDRYMTQYIVTGIGHLKKLNAIVAGQEDEISSILRTAIPYLDRKMKEDYDKLVKSKADLSKQVPGHIHIQYLYMRSFFPETAIPQTIQTAYKYYQKQARQTWMKQNNYMKGMIALATHRAKDLQTPVDILRSLKETALVSEEMGMYWKDQRFGFSWYWYYAPIETQALLIEAFSEISKDTKAIDDMRTWLIKHKQTNNWRTTKATAEAVYAMLLQGEDWLTDEPLVQIQLGNTTISNSNQKVEAGTGYFKQTIEGRLVKPEMGNIKVSVTNNNPSTARPSWGAVYWQYFEEMDKVTSAATPLQLSKKLFIETNTDRGPVLNPVMNSTLLKVGDKIKVRIELRVDRDMEYVHMKDLRASAFEPVTVISSYKWQGGLGYYETTKDASTSFFFPYLRKGTYVFEYPMFVTHAGNFSNGITTIQSFYAPEFSAHSEGIRVTIE